MLLPIAAADVRRVELLRVSGSPDWEIVTERTLESAAGADAVAIVRLVAALPDGGMMRCFNPVYAIEAHGAEGVLVEVAFCFRCRNALVTVPGGGRPELFGFDVDSPAGQELLARFKAVDRPGT
jgi:hypothetical protein